MKEWKTRFGNISYGEVREFREAMLIKIQERVELTIDDRLNAVQPIVESSICFYNDFLDRQNRYRQETPQQRQAEKVWIEWQRQQLQRSLASLEAIPAKFS